MLNFKRKPLSSHYLKQLSRDINPDEIFLDAKNLPNFDKDQFEGRIEQPLGTGTIIGVVIAFLLIEIIFSHHEKISSLSSDLLIQSTVYEALI